MCGVVAVSLIPNADAAADELAAAALRRLMHRGPDGFGVIGSRCSAVGMCRLRVRSAPADPVPFVAAGHGTAYAFNGEVYAAGGDAVPAGGLAEAQAVARAAAQPVDGMYALLRRDPDGTIEVTRDPLGIKPLYLRTDSRGVAVASEIPALLGVFGPARVRPAAIAQFLLLGRVVDGGTFFEGVEPIRPGETLMLKEGMAVRAVAHAALTPASGRMAADELRRTIGAAVRRTLVSDRSLGVALSGGLDSTVLALELNRLGIDELTTVSVLPDDTGDGIRSVAQLALPGSAWRGWRHHTVSFGPGDLFDGMPAAVAALGEPTAMTSVPMYAALARLARESGIVVLLVGEGADELFGGYRSYLGLSGLTSAADFYLSPARAGLVDALIGVDRRRDATRALLAAIPDAGEVSARVRRFEYEHSLEPLLRRTDHLLMSRGVEGRTPFLHAGVAAAAAAMPMSDLVAGGQTKVALRAAYAAELPQFRSEIKRPFRAPIGTWTAGQPGRRLRADLDRHLDLLAAAGVDTAAVPALLDRAEAGDETAVNLAFCLLSLGTWWEWIPR